MSKTILLLMLLCSCSVINRKFGLDDDNFAEEAVEFAIQSKLEFDVDLTPNSIEHRNY